MAKKRFTEEVQPRGRRSRFELKHTYFSPKIEVMDTPHDKEERVDANGNITTVDRDFSNVEDYRDYSIEVLSVVNPAMLTGNPLTMNGGTPIESADKINEYMSRVGSNVDQMEADAFAESTRKAFEDSIKEVNNEVKTEE